MTDVTFTAEVSLAPLGMLEVTFITPWGRVPGVFIRRSAGLYAEAALLAVHLAAHRLGLYDATVEPLSDETFEVTASTYPA